MNKRINELMIQAIDYACANQQSMDTAMEKFAELILAEVGQHLTNRGLDHAREVVEKDFGI